MKLKGEMVIELTDTNTGAVETVQETNMITEADVYKRQVFCVCCGNIEVHNAGS